MKKLFLILAAAFAMVACQTDINEVGVAGGEVDVTFEVGTPTRAYSDGKTATRLQYAIYDETGARLTAHTKTNETINITATVELKLVTGNSYTAIFWASEENAPYTVDFDAKTMTVNYNGVTCNDENLDAFYAKHEFTVKGAQTETIELRRPFAQLNIGTNDYDASANAGYVPVNSYVEVAAYKTLKLATGNVEEQTTRVFHYAAINKDETFPVAAEAGKPAYKYLAMNYLLVDADKETVDVVFGYSEGDAAVAKTRTVGSVPVQRNYRTNIYGQLLTSDVDINVVINPEYETPNNDQQLAGPWGGKVDTTWYNDTDTEFVLEYHNQLAGLAKLVDEGNDFAGKTIKLGSNLDMSGANWDPIGDNRTDKAFKGIFDGQNFEIQGLHYSGSDCWNGALFGDKRGFGLFSLVEDAVIKNVELRDETFASYTVITGAVAGYAQNTTFENIKISDTKISGYNWYTGGVVGWASGECTFRGINLEETTYVGTLWDSHGQNAGGIAGGINSSAKITIEDCNIACVLDVLNDITSNYKWCVYRVAGMIIGNTNTTETKYNEVVTATATNVTCNNVTVTYGDWMNYHYCEGYWQRGWGRYESSEYVGGVDEEEPHNHAAGEQHYVCLPFDQLFGGSANGSGHYPVKGLREFPGVTVNYPASYRREVSSAAALTEALGKGVSVILDEDIDFGSTQLAITGENQVVDLGGHALTTSNNWGGISLKNGAVIKNGTITHAGNTAAIKAFNGTSVENVTINATCSTADKTVTGIAVQQGANVESIKDVTINGVSQGIEVGYQATVGLIENAVVNESNNGTAKGIGLVINGGKVVKAKDCTFKGETYGITLHLKGVFAAGLELENCKVEGTTASIYAWDEKGISNTSGSLNLTYDAATVLTGPFVWDFEDECKSVVTLNKPQ